MKNKVNYHLVRYPDRSDSSRNVWVLKRHGAKRALKIFDGYYFRTEFDGVLSATMTYADNMLALFIHNDDGSVRCRLGSDFIELWRDR